MQEPAKQEKHFGVDVFVNPVIEKMRESECLCLNCKNLKPGESGNCTIAEDLYQICVDRHVALAVTRCPLFCPLPPALPQ